MDVFDGYESEFHRLVGDAAKAVAEVTAASEAGPKRAAGERARKLLADAQSCIDAMTAESRARKPAERRPLSDRISQARDDLAGVTDDFNRAWGRVERGELMSTAGRLSETSTAQRGALLAKRERLERTGDTIDVMSETVRETEEIGVNVMSSLNDQRETLLRSKGRVQETNSMTDTARRVLTTIHKREVTNKCILCFVIIVLMGVIGTVVYFGWFASSSSSSSSTAGKAYDTGAAAVAGALVRALRGAVP